MDSFYIKRILNRFIITVCICLCSNFADATETIKYIGSSTVGKFMQEAAKVYTQAEFDINTAPESTGGEQATVAGWTDIGGVAREVKPAILEKGVQKYLIGKDAIGAWVNSRNPVSALSTKQLQNIFSGRITNWKEVGGSDIPISIYIVSRLSATRKVFNKKLLDGDNYECSAKTVRPDSMIIDKVARDVGGIGHLSFALGDSHPEKSMVKKIHIDGEEASVNNPNYPVTRPIFLITKGEPAGAAKAFIDWALSDAGQKVVKKYFVGRR